MKPLQQHGILIAFLLTTLLGTSPAVFAQAPDDRDNTNSQAADNKAVFWSIPSLSKRWDAPADRGSWSNPNAGYRWYAPKSTGHWTIPRTANDLVSSED